MPSRKGPGTSRIFISYRREDDPGHAGRVYDQLSEHFGEGQVFMDVDALEPGVDFVERIDAAVAAADAFIAVIGRGWLTSVDSQGRRRLDNPRDFVRIEVEAALRRGIRLIPVLVGGAAMPPVDDLPVALAPLARRNALTMSDLDWRAGMTRLVRALDEVLGHEDGAGGGEWDEADSRRREPEDESERKRRPVEPELVLPTAALVLGLAGAAALALGTAMRWKAFTSPDFGPVGTTSGLGFFTSLAPLGVAIGAILTFGLLAGRSARRVGVGLLLGFALGGAAKYLSVLGQASEIDSPASNLVAGAVLALLGSAGLAAAAWLAWSAWERGARARPADEGVPSAGRVFALLGAVLVGVGTVIPFNGGGPGLAEQVILERSVWEALDPLACAVLVAVAVLLPVGARGRPFVAGFLVALGLLSVLLWLRYLGVPLLQSDAIASFGPGSAAGLAGAGLILIGGLAALPRSEDARFAERVPA